MVYLVITEQQQSKIKEKHEMDELSEFVETIKEMRHRERMVYDLRPQLCEKYSEYGATTVELYVTKLFKNKGCPMNLNVKITNEEGDIIKNHEGKTLFNKSKYIERCDDDYFTMIYNLLG
jgi:hypothetical protein